MMSVIWSGFWKIGRVSEGAGLLKHTSVWQQVVGDRVVHWIQQNGISGRD